ncbi:MAG: hypothetical protein JJU40_02465 [Rhodobacteraceae bacterium]|nr:hypothetical protein [Paracoccaceae bacterium]
MAALTPEAGVLNLLENCAQAKPGDRLLIAYEPPEFGYCDGAVVGLVSRVARGMGLTVATLDVGFNADDPRFTPELLEQIAQADYVLFLARLGDQLRFSEMPPGKPIIVSFALTQELFASSFANGNHHAFLGLKTAANTAIARAQEVRITCPLGTEVTGRPEMNLSPEGDTTILRFPMSIFTPVPAHSFSGRVALRFLTGTGSRYYDAYTVEFDAPVHAQLEQGRLIGFEGDSRDVDRANAQYDRVSRLFGIDRDFVHSWHAGIHPGCGFPGDMRANWWQWGGVAFGNPRILHFHTCGAYAPGEISWNIFDPTVTADGVALWDAGTLRAERLPGGPEILGRHPDVAALFQNPDRNIGLRATG